MGNCVQEEESEEGVEGGSFTCRPAAIVFFFVFHLWHVLPCHFSLNRQPSISSRVIGKEYPLRKGQRERMPINNSYRTSIIISSANSSMYYILNTKQLGIPTNIVVFFWESFLQFYLKLLKKNWIYMYYHIRRKLLKIINFLKYVQE